MTILIYTSPAQGHLFPAMAVAAELRNRGHRVHIATYADAVPKLRGLGFDATPIDPQVESVVMRDYQARTAPRALAASVSTFVQRATFDGPDLSRLIEDLAPQALLIDVNSWGALAAAERWDGPWAAFCPYPLPVRSADAPPFGPGLPPAAGPLGRMRDTVLRPLVLGTMERTMLPGLNQVRSTMSLPALNHLDDQFRTPPLMLAMTAQPFEYARRDWPANVALVGPCEWEPPAEVPGWLSDLAGPIVAVTTSSEFQDDGRLIRTALTALADEDVTVVATAPSGHLADFDVPRNARLERFVSHTALFERAACVVTHAGMGSTQKALARGVPVVAVPFGRDQAEVARRVAVAGAGVRLPARRLSPQRLRSAVRAATALRAGAQRVADGFVTAGGARAAADAFEHTLLTTHLTPPPGS